MEKYQIAVRWLSPDGAECSARFPLEASSVDAARQVSGVVCSVMSGVEAARDVSARVVLPSGVTDEWVYW